MSEVNLPLRFAFWEESDKTTHFFVHVSLLILCWVVITEQFGQVAPTNLGSFSDKKMSGGNDYTNKKTSNLLDNHKPSNMEVPRKTKVPFSKVIIRHFFRLHVSRVYRGFALHLCFTFYEACTKLALVFYNLSGLHRSLGSCRLCISCQYSVTTNTLLPSLAIKPWGWP